MINLIYFHRNFTEICQQLKTIGLCYIQRIISCPVLVIPSTITRGAPSIKHFKCIGQVLIDSMKPMTYKIGTVDIPLNNPNLES